MAAQQSGSHAIELEKAAQILRQRLAFATMQTRSSDGGAFHAARRDSTDILASPRPESISRFKGSNNTQATSEKQMTSNGMEEMMQGLGIGISDRSDAEHDAYLGGLPSSPSQFSPSRRNSGALNEPSLYSMIFGPSFQQDKFHGARPSDATRSTVSLSGQLSPHVRPGSSAKLEKMALSPQLGAEYDQHDASKRKYGARESVRFAAPTSVNLETSGAVGFGISSPRWNGEFQMMMDIGSPRQHQQRNRSRQSSHDGAWTPGRPPSAARMRSPSSQSRHLGKRSSIAGSAVLPNGHPASSLAQDLGIGRGGLPRTPRSRHSSSNAVFNRRNDEFSPPRSSMKVKEEGDDDEMQDPEKLAGYVLANLERSGKHSYEADVEDQEADDVIKQRDLRKHLSTFADPSTITPRRRQRSSGGLIETPPRSIDRERSPYGRRATAITFDDHQSKKDVRFSADKSEDAAHSLLNLASSPSTQDRLSRSRFGTPDGIRAAHDRSSRRNWHDEFSRLTSPPITPPRSDEVHANTKTEQGSRGRLDLLKSPKTPSRRPGQLTLVDEEEADDHEERNQKDADSRLVPSQELAAEVPAPEESSKPLAETPRTPPPMPRTPHTPKAPGSNFSYGDFLHVSPSPQPRMRTISHDPQLGSGPTTAAMALGHPLTDTPTRATRSRARFLDFNELGSDGQQQRPNLAESLNSKPSSFTVGPLAHNGTKATVSISHDGLGLANAFEEPKATDSKIPNGKPSVVQKTSDDDDHDNHDNHDNVVLVPGKRAALVNQLNPAGSAKRLRRQSFQS